MTGQQLYDLYRQKFEERGCGTDAWDELSIMDQEVWSAMADELNGQSN